MTLAKKTVILSKNGAKGYITIVRVGSSTGIKYVIDSEKSSFLLALKIGYNPLIIKSVESVKGEVTLESDIDFKNTDDISCMVVSDGNVFAEGGLRGRIQLQDVIYRYNRQKEQKKAQEASVKQKPIEKKEKEIKNKTEAINGIQEKSKGILAKGQESVQQTHSEDKELVQESPADSTSRELKKETAKEKQQPEKNNIALNIPKDMKGFYYSVKDKLDELFVMYPREEQLEKIIPCSKWVRINYDKEDYYVAGVLLDENDKVTHIAYGVPGFEGMSPPKEAQCICDWLPIKNMQRYQGYWLIFQSADTGEILPID